MKRKPFTVLFSLAVAFILWLYVITVVTPDFTKTFYGVAVNLDGESILTERGLMLVSDSNPTVQIRLKGNRSDLINIDAANLTAIADLTGITEPGEYELNYTVKTPSGISTTMQDQYPATIAAKVVERMSKKVSVAVEYTGTLPEGYLIDKGNEILDYEEITVDGPKDVVERIDEAVIQIDCDDRTESFVESQRFVLRDSDGIPLDVSLVTTDVSEIRLEVRVSKVKTFPLVLTVNDGGGATKDNTSITIEPEQITVSGGDAVLENLDELNIGTINLADILDDEEREFEITLPEGIRNESGITTAKVTISFPKLSKKELTVTNIQTTNVTSGMEATLLTQQLTITVRGPRSQVTALTAEDITAVLDLSGVVNTDAVTPQFVFADSFLDVGVVGKYTVSVTVAVPAETTGG